MSCIDSDLEEGEILDDSPSSPYVIDKKDRELPRRYVIQENKSIHKHKKDCKYAIRYHAKKLAKLKKTPTKIKDNYKKHHKSTCQREKSRKLLDRYGSSNVQKHLVSKNGHSFSKNSLITEMEDTFKDHFLSRKQNMRHNKSESEKLLSKTKNVKISNDNFDISEMAEKCNNSELQLNNSNSLSDPKQLDQHLGKNMKDLVNTSSETNTSHDIISNNSPGEKEESEDEEELRRIALATCAKRKLIKSSENVNNFIVSVPKSPEVNVQISHHETSNPISDNYEVVDMEVDEDIQSSIEIPETSMKSQGSEFTKNLFIIDTNPSADFQGNIKCASSELQPVTNSSDDDFETDILRAELIDSMYRKKSLLDEHVELQKPNVSIHHKQILPLPEEKCRTNYKKSNINFCHKQLRPAKHILKKNTVNKSENLKCNADQSAPIQINKSSERLIIALNEESSSEDSEDNEVNSVPENPVASIEALISDCRQKSDSNEKTQEVTKHIPKAVSCLSKAQQEEYNSLMKILAEKKRLPASPEIFQHKNGSVHSPLDELKLLEGKLLGFKETLKKKKDFMTYLSKEINSKKVAYIKSKLSAQHLKEKYIAAEKNRKIKLYAWSESCNQFKIVKKTVSDLEKKIIQLQNLCSKVGASIQGQTYNLPSLPAGNEQS